MKKKRIQVVLAIGLLMSVGFIALGNFQPFRYFDKTDNEENTDGRKKDPVQVALLQEMQDVLSQFDSTNKSYSLVAFFTAVDKTDPEHALKNIPYIFSKNEQLFYYKFGETETVNDAEVSVFVDHSAQTIVLGPSKKIVQPGMLPFSKLYDLLASEGYSLSKTTVSQNVNMLSMLNPNHITCKELQVYYNPVSLSVSKIYMRLADISDHMDAAKEKFINLQIHEFKRGVDVKTVPAPRKFVKKQGENWIPAPLYENYKLLYQ